MSERDPRGFPIQGDLRRGDDGRMYNIPPIRIPWEVAKIAYTEYAARYGYGQTLERLAERHGFSRDELLELLAGRAERTTVDEESRP